MVTNVLVVTNASAASVRSSDAESLEVLADPVRRRLVESLTESPRSVTDLAATVDVSRSAVSQHLGVLAGAGLVDYRVDGRRHLYHVKPDGLAALRAYLDDLWDNALATYAALFERESAAEPTAAGKDQT